MTDLYFPKNNFLANKIYSDTYKIITVSKGIEQKIIHNYNYLNLKTIYNPIDIEAIEYLSNIDIAIEERFIIAAGRMQDDIKQFDKLITSYSKSVLPAQNIKLIILGDGIEKDKLIKQVKDLQLEDKILFKGKVENPFVYFKKALYTILSSRYEGFGNVLIESLACGTPVVAFDCNSGPSEIIIDKENGLLVENQSQEKLIEAMNEMFLNDKLYYHCKKNAKASVQKFSIENIGLQWLELMKIK
jgi:N-acetylgalactosamine-N,N'-diacetylbacillosaminyl-diphospho-undecaprenol 4-alpha-N-acetylgalactosaminyltransferase